MLLLRVLFPAILLVFSIACAGQHEPTTTPAPAISSNAGASPAASFAPYSPEEPADSSAIDLRFVVACAPDTPVRAGEICRELDLNGDGRPDVHERRQGSWVIVKRIDFNSDQAPDQWVWTPDRLRPECTITLFDFDADLRPDKVVDPCGLRGTNPKPAELPSEPWPP